MFRYAVRIEGDARAASACLMDWPGVRAGSGAQMLRTLKEELLLAIVACQRSRSIIPVPRTKPCEECCVRLSAGQSLKVLVMNELHSSDRDLRCVARDLGVSESAVRRAIDLNLSTDVDLLGEILAVLGKRFLAYTSAS